MNRWHAGLLTILLSGLSALCAACPQPDCLRIGSWNIEWLGSSHRQQPQDDATINTMARMIADEWSIDLIALQEINTELEGTLEGQRYTRQSWKKLNKALRAKGYQTFAGSSGYAQRLVLAWRQPAKLLSPSPTELALPTEYTLGESCRSSRLRKPLAGYFQAGRFDFWLLNLHLKSTSSRQANCSSSIRLQQSLALSKEAKNLARIDADVILIGDFNASQGDSTLKPLLESGFHTLHPQKPLLSQGVYHNTNEGRRGDRKLIDYTLVPLQATHEWLPHSAMVFQPSNVQHFTQTYSDHLPVWVDFSTLRDDD